MKITKLDVRGFSHDIILVGFVVVFAIAGVGYVVASHADRCPPVSSVVSQSSSKKACTTVSAPTSGVSGSDKKK